jgi:hypothetical protein
MDIIKPAEPTQQQPEGEHTGAINTADTNTIALQGYFGGTPSVEEKDQLGFIYKFFEANGARSMPDILLSIKQIESKLGVVPMGESRVTQVFKYLKIQQDIAKLSQLRDSMYGW